MSAFAAKAKVAWQVMAASYVGLLLLLLVSTFSNAPDGITSKGMMILTGMGIWLFKIAPLLLFVPGLIKGLPKTSAWLAYMIMLYFVLAVMLVFTPGAGGQGWLMVLLTMSVFMSAMLHTRWHKRAAAGL